MKGALVPAYPGHTVGKPVLDWPGRHGKRGCLVSVPSQQGAGFDPQVQELASIGSSARPLEDTPLTLYLSILLLASFSSRVHMRFLEISGEDFLDPRRT